MATEWTPEDQLIAHASGWGIFGARIERLDDPQSVGLDDEPLESDEAAQALVEEAAACGDLHAQRALTYIKENR